MRAADSRLYASRTGRPQPSASTAERLSWAATLAHAVDMRMRRPARALARRGRLRRLDRARAGLAGGQAGDAAAGGNAARRRQGDRTRPHPLQARPPHARGVRARQGPQRRRRGAGGARRGPADGRPLDPPFARELRRVRVPRRPARRGDPAGLADHARRRRLRRDHQRASLPRRRSPSPRHARSSSATRAAVRPRVRRGAARLPRARRRRRSAPQVRARSAQARAPSASRSAEAQAESGRSPIQ